ncbi:hypothetical protein A2U01_0112914, partial [Trifolium medium]|nr:hypothetical protein [Trifolium medium]
RWATQSRRGPKRRGAADGEAATRHDTVFGDKTTGDAVATQRKFNFT